MAQASLLIDVTPVAAEAEDLIAITEDSRLLVAAHEALIAEGYQVTPANDGQRGDVLQIAFALAEQVQAQGPALAGLITAAITTLSTLSKHRRVGEIELSRGGEKLVIKDTDRVSGTVVHVLKTPS